MPPNLKYPKLNFCSLSNFVNIGRRSEEKKPTMVYIYIYIYIYSITDRKSASHPPSWVLERSEKPRAHRQQGLQLKSIIKSHPSLINVSLPSLQTQNDIQLRGFPVRGWVIMMNTLCTEFRWVNISTLPYSLIKQCVQCETRHLTAC